MTETAPGKPRWPELPYEAFAPTMHLLHMGLQMVGKLTLLKPFEPQWANVVLGLTRAWFQAMHTSAGVMERYRACFSRKTPPIGFMWGTSDLRDLRLGGSAAPPDPDPGYISRNATDEDQVMSGWWPGSEAYPRPAYYSFMHPKPEGIEKVDPEPAAARWDTTLGEFLIDYDDVRAAGDPEAALLAFLDSTYAAGASLAEWDAAWICPGRPRQTPTGGSI